MDLRKLKTAYIKLIEVESSGRLPIQTIKEIEKVFNDLSRGQSSETSSGEVVAFYRRLDFTVTKNDGTWVIS